MPSFTGPIRRVDTARRPYYKDANGLRVPGVTSLLNGVPKPALINWSADATAAYAVDNWDELAALPPSARLKKLKGARYEDTDQAGKLGRQVHELADPLARGEEVEVPDVAADYVSSYLQFLEEWNPDPRLIETLTINYKRGYVAILDAVFYFPSLDQTW